MINTEEINNKDLWESFVDEIESHSFLQSWQWGEFNKSNGQKVYRLGFYEAGDLIGVAQVIFIAAKRGSFFLVPHGPLIKNNDGYEPCVKELLRALENFNEYKKCSFVRVCSLLLDTEENRAMFKNIGFRNAPIHQHPELSWMIDIEKDEEEILKEMRKTTRHAIRKGEKDGVKITLSNNKDDLGKFWTLYEETVKRQHFTPFSKRYLEKEFDAFSENDRILLGFAEWQEKIVSGAFIVFSKDGAYYHHGASLHTGNTPTSQLLQWNLILNAKKRGCKYYNFWGIAPENKDKHPWAGISVFKKGFGGFAEAYVPAQDYIITKKYWLNYIVEKIRKWKRGF